MTSTQLRNCGLSRQKVLGIKSGDIVLCPSLTFAASANVILYENAVPIFIDVDQDYWTIDIQNLDKAIKKYNPKALIAVDLYGQSCNYEEIIGLCDKNNIFVFEMFGIQFMKKIIMKKMKICTSMN